MASRQFKGWFGAAAATALLAVGASAAAASAPGIHPQPVAPRHNWGSPAECASISGVALPGKQSAHFAIRALKRMTGHFKHDRRYADRAYWPVLKESASGQSYRNLQRHGTLTVQAAAKSTYAALVRNNCGAAIVKRSVDVVYTPKSEKGYQGSGVPGPLGGDFWMLKRDGHWLLWFEN